MVDIIWAINFDALPVDKKGFCDTVPRQCRTDHDLFALTISLVTQIFLRYVLFLSLEIHSVVLTIDAWTPKLTGLEGFLTSCTIRGATSNIMQCLHLI